MGRSQPPWDPWPARTGSSRGALANLPAIGPSFQASGVPGRAPPR